MDSAKDANDKFIDYIKEKVGKDKTITQRILASKIGCTEVSVSRYFNKDRMLSMDTIIKICNVLNIDSIKFLSFYKECFNQDELLTRIMNLSDDNKEKLIEYMDFLEYKEDKKKLVKRNE